MESIDRDDIDAIRALWKEAQPSGEFPALLNGPLLPNTRETALHIAVRTGKPHLVQGLLELNGPAKNSQGSDRRFLLILKGLHHS